MIIPHKLQGKNRIFLDTLPKKVKQISVLGKFIPQPNDNIWVGSLPIRLSKAQDGRNG